MFLSTFPSTSIKSIVLLPLTPRVAREQRREQRTLPALSGGERGACAAPLPSPGERRSGSQRGHSRWAKSAALGSVLLVFHRVTAPLRVFSRATYRDPVGVRDPGHSLWALTTPTVSMGDHVLQWSVESKSHRSIPAERLKYQSACCFAGGTKKRRKKN